MTNDFRSRLERELAALDTPPLADLAHNSLAQGRRLRTIRRRYQAGAAALVASLAVAGVMVGSSTLSKSLNSKVVPQPAASSVMPSPKEVRVEATPGGLLATLLEALPAGKTSHYAGHGAAPPGENFTPLSVQTYLDTGRGPGMLRLSIEQEDPFPKGRPTKPKTTEKYGVTQTSWTQKDGDVVTVSRNPVNCIQSLVVWVERPDGVTVGLHVASCLAFDGQGNTPAPRALTEKQAIKVADDDRLGLKLPKKMVAEGAERFPNLPDLT